MTPADGTVSFEADSVDPEITEPEATEPETTQPQIVSVDGGHMQASDTAWLGNGVYFCMENDITELPANADWSVEYAPVDTASIQLIRDGKTVEAARIGAGTLINIGDGKLWLKLEKWTNTALETDGGIEDDDILIISGQFVNEANGHALMIQTTYIQFNMVDGSLMFSEENPVRDDVYQAGYLTLYEKKVMDDTSIYVGLEASATDIPFQIPEKNTDYRPASDSTIQLIRDGKIYDVADPAVKTLAKRGKMYAQIFLSALKMELMDGDVLVINGNFTGGKTAAGSDKVEFCVKATYITVNVTDKTLTFSETDPRK